MKKRLNNKGFAISTVVYAILILFVIFMFTILVLYRNTYRNQKQFSADVQDELNEHLVEQTPPDTNPPACTLISTKNADGTYTLTISSSSTDIDLEKGYKFEGDADFANINTKKVSQSMCGSGSCKYKGYTKDATGNVTKDTCETTITFDTTPPTCTLTLSGSGTSVILTINSPDSDVLSEGYSFDNPTSFSSTRTKTVTSAGTYKAYVKDISGNISNACNVIVEERIATFKLKSSYLPFIDSPSDGFTDSCLASSKESCSVEAPEIILNLAGTVPYKNYTKGWGTSSTSTTITYSAGDSITLSGNETFYTVFKSNSSSSGDDSDDGSSGGGCSVGKYICSYNNGKCTSCETGNSNGACVSCSCTKKNCPAASS